MTRVIVLFLSMSCLASMDTSAQDNRLPLKASKKKVNELMELRFGMFVHWGPVSLSGRELSWGRNANRTGEASFNKYKDSTVIADPSYDTLYRSFLPAKDYAEKLVMTAKAAGMKYIVFTSKHHDGYPNFITSTITSSNYKDFFETPLGKSGRDLTKEIVTAARKAGLKIGLYYSQRDWTQPDYVRGDYQTYFLYMKKQLEQLLTQYGKIDILWFDSIAFSPLDLWNPPYLQQWPRMVQTGILINDRAYSNMGHNQLPDSLNGDYDTPEQQVGAFQIDRPWESCITLAGEQWSWKPHAEMFSTEECIRKLVNCAIGGGNLLLNVGPKADGYLEPDQIKTLRGIGDWLKIYGHSIYKTSGGPFVSNMVGGSTYYKKNIYLHILDQRIGHTLVLPAISAKIISVTTYDGRTIPFQQTNLNTIINTDNLKKQGPDIVLKLRLSRELSVNDVSKEGMRWDK